MPARSLTAVLALAFLLAILPTPAHAAAGQFGTVVTATEDGAVWFTHDLGTSGIKIVYDDTNNDNDVDTNENVYLHFGATVDLSGGDVQLSGNNAGKRITSTQANAVDDGDLSETHGATQSPPELVALLKSTDTAPAALYGGPDTKHGQGDGLYLDLDSNSVVSTGDLRIVATDGEAAFRFVVSNDNDLGDALGTSGVPLTGRVAAYDANGDGDATDATDPVYLDLDENNAGTPADIRLVAFNGEPAGQWLTWDDKDALSVLQTFTGAFAFNDADNDDEVDATENVILSIDSTVNSIATGDIRLTTASSGCPVFSIRDSDDTCDAANWEAPTTAALRYVDVTGNGLGTGDTVYLSFHASAVTIGDIRLTSYGNKAAGTRVATSDLDKGLTHLPLPNGAALRALDNDGSGHVSALDSLYIDTTGNKAVDAGDVRFTKTGSLAAGRFVAVTDADAEPVLAATPGDDELAYVDLGPNGFDIADPVLIRIVSSTGQDIEIGDLRISASSDGAAGTFVRNNDDEEDEPGIDAGMTFRYVDVTGGGFSTDDWIHATTGATAQQVQVKDVRITAVGTLRPGSRVIASNVDASDPNIAFTGSTVLWQDRDADGIVDPDDRVVLNVPTRGADNDEADLPVTVAGLLSRDDVRLSGSGGTTGTGAGSGGGGGGAPTTSRTRTTTSDTETTSSSSTSASGSESTTSTSTTPVDDIAQLNLAVQNSLRVQRQDGRNVLTWDSQPGVSGYQVWSSDSPFILVAKLEGQDRNGYTHTGGKATTSYLVTVYKGVDTELTAEQVNGGSVPGYAGVPDGESATDGPGNGDDGDKGFIPAPGLLVALAAIAVGLILVRRRL